MACCQVKRGIHQPQRHFQLPPKVIQGIENHILSIYITITNIFQKKWGIDMFSMPNT